MPDINSLIEKYGKTAIEQALGKFSHDDLVALQRKKPVVTNKDLTVVTGLWNLSKPGRSIEHYLECFEKILEMEHFMFIYIPKEFENFQSQKSTGNKTTIIV